MGNQPPADQSSAIKALLVLFDDGAGLGWRDVVTGWVVDLFLQVEFALDGFVLGYGESAAHINSDSDTFDQPSNWLTAPFTFAVQDEITALYPAGNVQHGSCVSTTAAPD